MIKYTEEVERIVLETVEYTIAPCFKCGNAEIELFNKEGFYPATWRGWRGGGKCQNSECGNKYTDTCGKNKYEAAEIWNRYNDTEQLIKAENQNIENAKNEIKRIESIAKVRSIFPKK